MTTWSGERPGTSASAGCWLIAIAAVSGCAAGGTELPGDAPIATSQWDASQGGMTALLEGELSLEDGCVYVVSPEGHRTLPVFPEDRVGWDADTDTLTYAGEAFRMGDLVAAGGGWAPPPESASIPAACEPDEWGDVMLVQDESLAP